MKHKNFLTLIFCTISIIVTAQNSIQNILKSEVFAKANLSIEVKDLKKNSVVFEKNAHHSLMPASTLKIVTTATALEFLGDKRRIETEILCNGTVDKKGTLNGDIVIKGGGDPTIASEKIGNRDIIKIWAEKISQFGIKNITGKIVPDQSIFGEMGVNKMWTWEDIGNYYAAGVYPIAYKDNTYQIVLKSGKIGTEPYIIGIYPNIGIKIINQLKAENINFDNAYIYGSPTEKTRVLKGEIPANRAKFVVKGDIPNPAKILISDLKMELSRLNIKVKNQHIQKEKKSHLQKIYCNFSPTIAEIATETNHNSNNLFAEHLFRYIGSENGEKSNESTANFIKEFWAKRGVDSDEMYIYDGSGLSPFNALSAHSLVGILEYMFKAGNYSSFCSTLPTAGQSGTVKNFLKQTKLEGKVRAKSGSFQRVRSYAGYVELNEKTYAFAIVVNNAKGSSTAIKEGIESLLLSIIYAE